MTALRKVEDVHVSSIRQSMIFSPPLPAAGGCGRRRPAGSERVGYASCGVTGAQRKAVACASLWRDCEERMSRCRVVRR